MTEALHVRLLCACGRFCCYKVVAINTGFKRKDKKKKLVIMFFSQVICAVGDPCGQPIKLFDILLFLFFNSS